MPRHESLATTRTATAGASRHTAALLDTDQLVASAESGLSYRIGTLLGQGGFGQVFLARRAGRSTTVPDVVCIKVSTRLDGWLREAYFGQLLHDHPRAVRVFDAFPLFDRHGRLLYGLAIEYAQHGDLSAFLARHAKRWSEAAVRREIAGVLRVLGKLHRGQLLHRDLTPMNVFVCEGHRLKLGDFGIVRQQSDRRGVTARTLNPLMAPSDIFDGAAPKWQARDDVYQVGQLIGMLVKGDATRRIRTLEVRSLNCSDPLKEIVYRCIGERRKRYESADELILALEQPPASMKVGRRQILEGGASRVHRHPERASHRGRPGRETSGCNGAQWRFCEDHGCRAWTSQSPPGGGEGRGAQAPGGQAAAREGPPDCPPQRGAVLACRRPPPCALSIALVEDPGIELK